MENAPERARATILVADDSPRVVRLVCNALEEAGYATVCASDGQEALDWLEANPPPDLIVSDTLMPRVDGFLFLERLHQKTNTAHIPVVVMASRHPDDRIEEKTQGIFSTGQADTGIWKPFLPEQIVGIVSKRVAGVITPLPGRERPV